MPRCLISFGANLGNARVSIEQAAEQLQKKLTTGLERFQLSPLFNTPPVGGPTGQPPFLNAVAAFETDSSAWEVWHAIRQVEQLLGRERFQRWEARRIDLDILLYDDFRIWTPQLKIPHPRMCMRRFILEPATRIAGDWIDPVSGRSIDQLASSLRQRKGSFVLCASPHLRPNLLLEEVARQAMAEWLTLDIQPAEQMPEKPLARWVALSPQMSHGLSPELSRRATALDHAALGLSETKHQQLELPTLANEPQPKLVIFFVEAQATSGAQWEDIHRTLAIQLKLSDTQHAEHAPRLWDSALPRYLLATDDRQWAVHEMVAALEAMDCPIEQL